MKRQMVTEDDVSVSLHACGTLSSVQYVANSNSSFETFLDLGFRGYFLNLWLVESVDVEHIATEGLTLSETQRVF